MPIAWDLAGTRQFPHEEFAIYSRALRYSKHEVSTTRETAGVIRLFLGQRDNGVEQDAAGGPRQPGMVRSLRSECRCTTGHTPLGLISITGRRPSLRQD